MKVQDDREKGHGWSGMLRPACIDCACVCACACACVEGGGGERGRGVGGGLSRTFA